MGITRASLQVRAWTERHTQKGLVRLLRDKAGLKVGQTTISDWILGNSTPGGLNIIALHRLLLVQPEDWFRPASSASARKRAPSVHRARASKASEKPPGAAAHGRTGTDD